MILHLRALEGATASLRDKCHMYIPKRMGEGQKLIRSRCCMSDLEVTLDLDCQGRSLRGALASVGRVVAIGEPEARQTAMVVVDGLVATGTRSTGGCSTSSVIGQAATPAILSLSCDL